MATATATATATITITTTTTTTTMAEPTCGLPPAPAKARATLGLLRLGSAGLPIGAFAYSQALEAAIEMGDVRDRKSGEAWVTGLLDFSILSGDVPILAGLHRSWSDRDPAEIRRQNDVLHAARGSRELREEDRQLGNALARLLEKLGCSAASPWARDPRATLACLFALAAREWGADAEGAALAYCFCFAEAQTMALSRLVPLGQTDAQRVLSSALGRITAQVPACAARDEARARWTAPGQALLSARHETQYTRLFRS
jgi:urease accessory protein